MKCAWSFSRATIISSFSFFFGVILVDCQYECIDYAFEGYDISSTILLFRGYRRLAPSGVCFGHNGGGLHL